jgi:hypothetical protein
LPEASVSRVSQEARVPIWRPPAVTRSPAREEEAVVPEKRVASTPPEKEEVELVPRTERKPWKVEVPLVVPWIEVVAVRPTYTVSYAERSEVEALVNCCSAVHVLGFARLRESDAEPPTRERVALSIDKELPTERVPVATLWYAVAPPYKSWPTGAVEVPVPPSEIARSVASVRTPAEEKLEVAVAPKDAAFPVSVPPKMVVPVAFVVVSPPLNASKVVVAFDGKRYAKVA